ncbi:hypothetical protein BATDEDRAFT_26531 [Batrachochytrium dendrobatidis JAM81]|uniref:HNH nuclease domain-containing protein n=1 Tax=Batrachochytrium dendrobatidis (strain JAM81 / FGSC 10211) TaxID=684364 RepID=F4P803_BATDJ|nr:uncharacterized protein BATDEDRAFT_26531 [Batrachochytrium dendrobatidis JAM81]EGF78479.1 hypothetical protein BATDEDRAFT_26531 [Batrachochytrium dendrobatidis JAM81]|eukprot:XP_006680693.1 hypothetical protein BATDEDRAFT_26531 [Batrachochytrium dendrobatidis JAM81]
MNIETTKTATTQLLNEYYQISTQAIPTQRVKSEWQDDNKRGLFLGIIQEGETSHITRLHNLLAANQFAEQQQFSTKIQLADPEHHCTFIDDMFGYYILPFHKDYNDSSSWHTPVSSNPTSRTNSADDLDYVAKVSELQHKDLNKVVEKRDSVCLFCWNKLSLQGAHIISQKNIGMAYNEPSILLRSGLTQKHQIQNGLLLCIKCHSQFGKLRRYVDVVDDKLVIKVINETNDSTSDKHKNWERTVRVLKLIRSYMQERWTDNRQAVESNDEMALYFIHNNPTRLPNRNALEFHKTTCLIWRMAGGVESDDEYCPYDDDDGCTPVDYRSKSIEKWMDSSATLIIENVQ